MELCKDLTNRNLGRRYHKCQICGAEGGFQSYLAREMQQGTGDEFEYFVCDNCLCMQIAEIPDNLGDYYGNSYYSFGFDRNQEIRFQKPVEHTEKILDVGCGSGKWLFNAANEGHTNLFGCDPFLDEDIAYGDRVYIRNCSIHEMDGDGTFDSILMQDSFEHVTDSKDVLYSARRLLKDDGILCLTLPIFPNMLFDMFGTYWYGMDPPRHIFLHSFRSLKYLADECNFIITDHVYDTVNVYLVYSFFYQHGISKEDINEELIREYFSDESILSINSLFDKACKANNADHIKIIMRKKE